MKLKPYTLAVLFFLMIIGAATLFAKPEYFSKEMPAHPGLTCMSCHQGIPKAGDKDKKLNDLGKQYQKTKQLPSNK